jgi:hypothetical protein
MCRFFWTVLATVSDHRPSCSRRKGAVTTMAASNENSPRERKTPLPLLGELDKTPPPFYAKLRRMQEDSQRESDPDGIMPPLIRPGERRGIDQKKD